MIKYPRLMEENVYRIRPHVVNKKGHNQNCSIA